LGYDSPNANVIALRQNSTPLAMLKSAIPRILRPDFSWPRSMHTTIAENTPPTPSVGSLVVRRFWGLVHRLLARFSLSYCSWFDIPFNGQIMELPFGLILKWSDRTRVEEVIAMQMARAAGMPVPKVLCCGEQPATSFRLISILMTRLPGWPLNNSGEPLEVEEEGPWLYELGRCLCAMRAWKSPFNGKRICSVAGTSISTQRVPNHSMGPVEDERELHEYLLSPASSHGFASPEEYHKTLALARKILDMPHRVVFTHGDFKAHNILIDDEGHLSGFLDWECAGWCPEYWEFATAMRFGRNSWWYQVASVLGGDQYLAELECDVALNLLTVDSYIAW
jgi:aminoglycoside phosphotransferase